LAILIHHAQTEFKRIAREAWSDATLATHWGFTNAATGLNVPNEAALQIDPT
jgi:hypothetical protein